MLARLLDNLGLGDNGERQYSPEIGLIGTSSDDEHDNDDDEDNDYNYRDTLMPAPFYTPNNDTLSDADDKNHSPPPRNIDDVELGYGDNDDNDASDSRSDFDEYISDDDDDSSEGFVYEYESESEFDDGSVYENDRPYQFAAIDDGLYLLRVVNSTERVVALARESHPLIRFTRALVHNEAVELRRVLNFEPESTEQIDANGGIPGVVSEFVIHRLHRAPKIVSESETHVDDAGDPAMTLHETLADEDEVPLRPESIDLHGDDAHHDAAELFTLDSVDVEYGERYATLVQILAGNCDVEQLRQFDHSHNRQNMAQFTSRGHTGAGGSADGVWSDVSPVRTEESWFAVKMHYLAMYRAFHTMHDSSRSLLDQLLDARQRVHATAHVPYAFGVPQGLEASYTPKQERAVLEHILDNSERIAAQDVRVTRARASVEQLCARVVNHASALRSVKLPSSKGVLPLLGTDPSVVVDDAASAMEALQRGLEELNKALAARSVEPHESAADQRLAEPAGYLDL